MERMTVPRDGRYALADSHTSEDALQRLAAYENAHEELLARQAEVEKELEKLRAEGRQKSGRFRELIARKLINQGILEQLAG